MTRALHEIMSTRFWDFFPDALHTYRNRLLENIQMHRPYVKEQQRTDLPYTMCFRGGMVEKTYIENPDYLDFSSLQPEDRVVAVIDIQGPVLRNGDLCSYGSKEHRDIIIKAADDERVLGFVIRADSPGGSSAAKYDYEMALEYAREKGKKIIGLVDGMAYSAAYAVMALCDEIYFTNPHDGVGCIGTMCAMYTLKDGEVNSVTQERYAEIYAEGSPYKNKEFRDAAEGNYESILKDLNDSCKDFQEMVRNHRPDVTQEQLEGKTYNAGDVIGSLVDAQGDFSFCVNRILASANSTITYSQTDQKESQADSFTKEDGQPAVHSEQVPAKDHKSNSNSKNETMAKSYPFIMSAAGVNALVVDENNGFYAVESMCENVEAFCKQAVLDKTTLSAKLQEISDLNSLINTMRTDHASALESLKKDYEKKIDDLKESHKKEMGDLNDKLKETEKRLEEKESEIQELSDAASHEPAPQDPPKVNEEGVGQRAGFKVESVCSDDLSFEEMAEKLKKRQEELKRRK